MPDHVYLARAESFLMLAYQVALEEEDSWLALEIRRELARWRDGQRFPALMLRMIAPRGSPERAAYLLLGRLLMRAFIRQRRAGFYRGRGVTR